jgi:ammonia channel protein AmtB
MVSMGVWASINSIAFFFLMKRLNLLRVNEGTEIIGLDAGELGIV